MLYTLFLSSCVGISWACFFFARRNTLHGRLFVVKGIHKDAFILFYLNGLLFAALSALVFPPTNSSCLLAIHLFRRLVEAAMYTYGHHSRMSAFHFIGGLAYYPIIILYSHTTNSPIYSLFLFSSFVQIISHYLLFRKRQFTYYTHYLTELLIHYSILQDPLNSLWIVSFALINAINRQSKPVPKKTTRIYHTFSTP